MDQYTGLSGVREICPGEGAVLGVRRWGHHTLLYWTQAGGLHAWVRVERASRCRV